MKRYLVLFVFSILVTNIFNTTSLPVREVDDGIPYPTDGMTSRVTIKIQEDEDYAYYNIPGNGTKANPYIIENYFLNLNGSDKNFALEIWNKDCYTIIRNCVFQGRNDLRFDSGPDFYYMRMEGVGIQLYNVDNVDIYDCSFYIYQEGIALISCENVTIKDCSFQSISNQLENPDFPPWEGTAIMLHEMNRDVVVSGNHIMHTGHAIALAETRHTVIENNTMVECIVGVESFHFSQYNLITRNSAIFNREGLVIARSTYTNVTYNNCSYNTLAGIVLDELSSDIYISMNVVEHNNESATSESLPASLASQDLVMGLGIWIAEGSSGNTIERNNLIGNEINAKNDVDGNLYDYNYYSDYTGLDEDNDGIGDTPYNVPGASPTDDVHPLSEALEIHFTTVDTNTVTPTVPEDLGMDIMTIVIAGFSLVAVVVIVGIVVRKR
ncbi:MAG: nitrous oxide reductase family maturation protein NosD [Candidatus Thorarchaeota archaeon]